MDSLEKFGSVLIKSAMDSTLNTMFKMTSGTLKGIRSEEMRELISEFSENEIDKVNEVIRMSVETTLFNVLFMVEEDCDIELIYDGCDLVEESDGLSGELFGNNGWIKKYSDY